MRFMDKKRLLTALFAASVFCLFITVQSDAGWVGKRTNGDQQWSTAWGYDTAGCNGVKAQGEGDMWKYGAHRTDSVYVVVTVKNLDRPTQSPYSKTQRIYLGDSNRWTTNVHTFNYMGAGTFEVKVSGEYEVDWATNPKVVESKVIVEVDC